MSKENEIKIAKTIEEAFKKLVPEKEPEKITREQFMLACHQAYEDQAQLALESNLAMAAIEGMIRKADYYGNHKGYNVEYLMEENGNLALLIEPRKKMGFKNEGAE